MKIAGIIAFTALIGLITVALAEAPGAMERPPRSMASRSPRDTATGR